MRKFSHLFLSVILMGLLTHCQNPAPASSSLDSLSLIPQPQSLNRGEGSFLLTAATPFYLDESASQLSAYITEVFSRPLGAPVNVLPLTAGKEGGINMHMDSSLNQAESYVLEVKGNSIQLRGRDEAGLFYGVQTLRQLLPSLEEAEVPQEFTIPVVHIEDAPRYPYRGLHLDVGRHFFPVDFIKRFIDLLAFHKLNTFHWHLTEDQGWRIEIKRYPKLGEIGGYRDGTLVGHYRDQPHQFDGKRYGGYYTQEEIKEVVAYAAERQVTVIPEIDIPGHALAALAAYPELACKPGPYEVAQKWGIFEEIMCPTEETFTFLENVFEEVIALFPSPYIHIGGDEAPKVRWEESAFCQKLMEEQGLEDVHELQSYFIKRIETFINSKGRRIIGWDEILEGGLAPNATVMSWQGISGGIEAARQGHDVVMTPTSHLYFDYYQADPANEPLAIGGNLPLEKVYHFEPTPEELTEQEAQHILGAQANLWTEYIPTGEKVEYMVYPRACALAELVWSPKEAKDFDDFTRRLEQHQNRLADLEVNFAKTLYHVTAQPQPDSQTHQLFVALTQNSQQAEIRYTLDGKDPNNSSPKYEGPIPLAENTTLKATSFLAGKAAGNTLSQSFSVNKASARIPTLLHAPSPKYNASPFVLTDGVAGGDIFNDLWYGFDKVDMEAVIDLEEESPIQRIALGVLHTPYAWIFYPERVSFSISTDGENFETVFETQDPSARLEDTAVKRKLHEVQLTDKSARYIKIIARNTPIPEWHGGKGTKGWLFADEIVIE